MAKVAKYLVLVFLAGGLVGAGWLAQQVFRFDLRMDPVTRPIVSHSGPWGERVNMVPRVFEFTQPFDEAEAKLLQSGFERLERDDPRILPRDRDEKAILFRRAITGLPCNEVLFVFIDTDVGEQEVFGANGTVYENGCL